MAHTIERIDVWSGTIDDKPGAVADVLSTLADAGADLEFVIARREQKGKGVIFLAPLKGAALARAGKKAGLKKTDKLYALRIQGTDKAGLGATICRAIADAGVNMRGVNAVAIGRRSAFYLSFDDKTDATTARRALNKTLK